MKQHSILRPSQAQGSQPLGLAVQILIGISLCALAQCAAADDAVIIEVATGPHARTSAPVSVALPPDFTESRTLEVTDIESGDTQPAQVTQDDPPQVVWIIDETLPADTSRRYRLRAVDSEEPPRVTCTDDGRALRMTVGERPVLAYHHKVLEPPEGIASYYRRSGFIHPLQTPLGRVLTDDFPPDHAHQHGIFRAWVNTTFEGRKVDFWNQHKKTGTVRHKAIERVTSGPVFAEFVCTLEHVAFGEDDRTETVVLEEQWTVRVYNIAAPFVIDLHSVQRNISTSPLTMNKYLYGGMAYRGHRDWLGQPEHDFLTSEGKHRADGNHTHTRWVTAYGLVDGNNVSATVIGHPSNFRAPQSVRLHPTMPYFVFSPVVEEGFEIRPGETHEARFRYTAQDSVPSNADIQPHWINFATPPKAKVVSGRTR